MSNLQAQPTVPAPAPTLPQSEVVSLFSDVYTTTGKGFEFPTWCPAPQLISIGENDNIVKIAGLGTSFAHITGWKIAGKAYIHLDVYWESGNGTFTFGFTSGYNANNMLYPGADYVWPALTQGQWIGIDIPTDEWLKLGLVSTDLSAFASIQFKGNGTYYADNIYAWGTPPPPVIPAPPVPAHAASDVVSIISDSYTAAVNFQPQSWPQCVVAAVEQLPESGRTVVNLTGLGDAPVFIPHWNISGKGIIHIDVYDTGERGSGEFFIGLSNEWNANPIYIQPVHSFIETKKRWTGIDLKISDFQEQGLNLSDIISVRFRGLGNFYISNFYAYGQPGDEPGGGDDNKEPELPEVNIPRAPLATHFPENVTSVFCDRYVPKAKFDSSAEYYLVKDTKDKVAKTVISSHFTVDVATWNIPAAAFVHLDYYTADGSDFRIELGDGTSYAPSGYSFPATAKNQWVSLNIPATAFASAGLNLADVKTLRLLASGTFYIDNVFAYIVPANDGTFKVRTQFGVNMSGGEFGGSALYPDNPVDWQYYEEKGLNLIRVPFKWERIQSQVGGALSATDLAKLKEVVQLGRSRGMEVFLDMHNYGRGKANGTDYVIGATENVTTAHFADVWRKLATEFKDYHLWGYDIMNEPHDMGTSSWFQIAQAAINAIREVDTETPIIIEGNNWASADTWPSSSDALKSLVDPSNRIIYEAHCYFDADGSGTYKGSYPIEVGSNSQVAINRLSHFVDWLKANNKTGMIGELGVPGDDQRWLDMFDGACAYLKSNNVSLTYWSGGRHWGDYILGIHPDKSDMTKEKPQMAVYEKYGDYYSKTAIGEVRIEKSNIVSLYPNPVSDVLNIRSETPVQSIRIYSLTGQLVSENSGQNQIELGRLAKGNFVARILLDDNSVVTRKVIKL
jgi:aryl-phospho-beta-D-glucosidase BglC (GH1 family)